VRTTILFIFLMLILSIGETSALPAETDIDKIYTLPVILDIAVDKNPSMAVFRANIETARGELRSAKAYPNPDLEFEFGEAKPLDQQGAGYKHEDGFGVSQSLEWPGKRRYRRKAAEAEIAVSQQELESFRLELIARVKETFFSVLLADKLLETARKNLETAQTLVNSAELRTRSGEAPELELIKARVEYLKALKDSRRTENRVRSAKTALDSLLGGALGKQYEIAGDLNGSGKGYELASLIERMLIRHPLILRQKKALEAADYTLSKEQHTRVPDLTVKGSFNDEIDKRSYAVGLSIPFPLFYLRQGEVATARAAQARASAGLEQTRVELTRLVTEQYQNYLIATDQIKVFDEGLLKQADEALRIAQFSYQQGESDLLNLLDAQRVQREMLIEYYEAQFELQTALVRLEQATGGLP
jgi:cobalt-zinc-cadmium efflux system outer membrane protein